MVEYDPPANSWRIKDLLKASKEEVDKSVVGCGGCPVNLLCMEGAEGTSGFGCKECKSTSMFVGEENENEEYEHVLVFDCAQHKFDINTEVKKCPLCTGSIGLIESTRGAVEGGTKHHLLLTEHAKVPRSEEHTSELQSH